MKIGSRFVAAATLSVCLALTSMLVSATTQVSATVQSISVYAGTAYPGVQVIISPALPNGTEGCTNLPANTLFIDFSSTVQPDGKSLYASVLVAMLAGKVMTFGILGCALSGQLPLIYRVDVMS